MYAHTSVFFHCLLRFFFLFSGDNTLPKAIDILMRCYQGFFVAINFIIRMLVLRAFVIIFFFFRCPMLTFNDLPHFLPLLYLIIDCDLHTRTHSLALIRSIIITLSLSLPPSPYFSLQLSRISNSIRSASHSFSPASSGIEQFAFRSLALYLFGNKWKRYCWQRTFCFTTNDHSFIAKWRSP